MSFFKGKTVLVTGAGRGIGRACAIHFSSLGANLVIASRTLAELESTAQEIRGPYLIQVTDISNEPHVDDLFAAATERFGAVDVLVNNAAVVLVKDLAETSATEWRRLMGVNIDGMFFCTRALFKQGKPASIVNISSLGGIRGTQKFPGMSAYVTSKAAVVGFTESAAVEGKALGIRVNAVAPGAVETSMLQKAAPFLKTSLKPGGVAPVIEYLADSSKSGAVSGSTLEIFSNE